jgi:hypothetical protein
MAFREMGAFVVHTHIEAGRYHVVWSCARCRAFLLESVLPVETAIEVIERLEALDQKLLHGMRHRCKGDAA